MIARYATQDEIKDWNNHVVNNPDGGNVFSSVEYGEVKKTNGYKVRYVFVDKIAVLVLEKNTPPLGRLWYLPKGPGVTNTKLLFNSLDGLKTLAKKRGVFVIRIESELPKSVSATIKRRGLLDAKPVIPNPSTITIDISPSTDDILTTLPQKGRHAINRAIRDGVLVKRVKASDANCKKMYTLLSDTAKGQFGIRSYSYYSKFWKSFEAADMGQLFFAYFENKVVAGAFAMRLGYKSTYKDGASIRKRTAYGASHLLQWDVINWAKENGATIHDLCGAPPSDEINNPNHPHYGIGLFKTSFNKSVTDYIGCYDYVISKSRYTAWVKLGEKLYQGAYRRLTKDYYY